MGLVLTHHHSCVKFEGENLIYAESSLIRPVRILLWVLFASTLIAPPAPAASEAELLTICTSINTGFNFISAQAFCNERIFEKSTWYQEGKAPKGTPGSKLISLILCTSNSNANLRVLRKQCNQTTQTQSEWQRPLGPPAAPVISSLTAIGLGKVMIESKLPFDNGGARVSRLSIVATPYNSTGTIVKDELIFNEKKASQFTLTALTPGANYKFTLTATNSVGTSLGNATVFLIPDIPSAPTIAEIAAAGSNGVLITYSAPESDGGSTITSYTVTASPGDKSATVTRSASGTINISGLNAATTYSFTITASNLMGRSAPSAPSKTILMASPTITATSAATKTTALITYSPPQSDGVALITSYTATATPSGESATVTRSGSGTITISNLTYGESYSFTISAITNTGITLTSTATRALLMALVPGAPTITSASACGGGCVQIFFTPPTTDGGATISSYTATASPSGANTTITDITSRNFIFTGLQSGTDYTFTITANNSVGKSLPSEPSAKVRTHSAAAAAAAAPAAITYAVGDTGPGGGIVYYYLAAGFNCGTGYTTTGSPTGGLCNYLEVAPSGWNTGSDPTKTWATGTSSSGYAILDIAGIANETSRNYGTSGIGLGYKNSLAIVAQGNDTTTAGGAARAYAGGSKSDWYLPTSSETNQLCKWNRNQLWTSDATVCIGTGTLNTGPGASGAGFTQNYYYVSNEYGSSTVWSQSFLNGWGGISNFQKYQGLVSPNYIYVRPVRSF